MEGERGTIEVAPLLVNRYVVLVRPGEWPGTWGREHVPCSDDDRERWAAARQVFEEDLRHAQAALTEPVERPWWRRTRSLAGIRWLPGYRAEQRARAAEREKREARAEERYRPVHEEIHARVKAVREERERVAREAWERKERLQAVVRREVWGWLPISRTVAVVFRHDVALARLLPKLPEGVKARGPMPLDKLGNELFAYEMKTVRWDPAAKRAVAADCAAAGHPLSFTQWWEAAGPWEQPDRAPAGWCTKQPWPVVTRRGREQLHGGTGHHSSYGVGDAGGSGFGSF